MGAARFRAGVRLGLAAEKLQADHGGDLVAVNVDVAHIGALGDMGDKGFMATVDAQRRGR